MRVATVNFVRVGNTFEIRIQVGVCGISEIISHTIQVRIIVLLAEMKYMYGAHCR